MSQDHIELFFGKIRSMGGCNNNPTSMQFFAAYKKILIHNDIQDVLCGNCLPLESVPILKYSSNISHECNSVEVINASPPKNKVIEDFRLNESDDNEEYRLTYIPTSYHLSLCSSSIVAYIAGFDVYKLKKSLRCEACLEGLSGNNNKAMKRSKFDQCEKQRLPNSSFG